MPSIMRTSVVQIVLAMAVLLAAGANPVIAQDRVLRADMHFDAAPQDVWELWTTQQGLQSFFAPAARIEPKVDGVFEILFSPEKPAGERGAEGLRIIAFEPPKRLAFTWNAPQALPAIREQRTVVEVRLEAAGKGTAMTFLHWGWGTRPEWDKAYDYFDQAWNAFVLPSLQYRIEKGPGVPPPGRLKPVSSTLKRAVAAR